MSCDPYFFEWATFGGPADDRRVPFTVRAARWALADELDRQLALRERRAPPARRWTASPREGSTRR